VLAAEEDIATIMTMEGGKPLKESKGEFASGYAPMDISLYLAMPQLVLLCCSCFAHSSVQSLLLQTCQVVKPRMPHEKARHNMPS